MFDADVRERLRERVLRLAEEDPRVVAGAVVGSLAFRPGDRWSDLDLTFAVADDAALTDVLEEWSRHIEAEFDAVRLFDLPSGASIYRVFLLPGGLQFDLSFTPAARFGARGPEFRLLFGTAVELPQAPPPDPAEMLGQAAHHVVRARVCLERGKNWQAEYWISATRDLALGLACRRHGLPTSYGRGFDALPAELRDDLRGALVTSLERAELLRALGCAVEGLLREADAAPELAVMAARLAPRLRRLAGGFQG